MKIENSIEGFDNMIDQHWGIILFGKSVPKQRKFREITELLGDTKGLKCLDIGSDNGVISYLLRERGGHWKSADLDEQTVLFIRDLVKQDVYQINGRETPFGDNEFDRVVIVDFLEHIHTDSEFIGELYRIIKPGGELIINVPHIKNSLLRKFRLAIGQTDEKHGHVRQGYTSDMIKKLLTEKFDMVKWRDYSKGFSELIDTAITFIYGILIGSKVNKGVKGLIVTGKDLNHNKKLFRIYSLIYPIVWFFGQLDRMLFYCSGYMLIVKARINK